MKQHLDAHEAAAIAAEAGAVRDDDPERQAKERGAIEERLLAAEQGPRKSEIEALLRKKIEELRR